MNERDKTDFKDLVHEIFDERRTIDEATHIKHHEFTTVQIEIAERKKKFWGDMTLYLTKAGALGALTVVGYALWHYVKHEMHR